MNKTTTGVAAQLPAAPSQATEAAGGERETRTAEATADDAVPLRHLRLDAVPSNTFVRIRFELADVGAYGPHDHFVRGFEKVAGVLLLEDGLDARVRLIGSDANLFRLLGRIHRRRTGALYLAQYGGHDHLIVRLRRCDDVAARRAVVEEWAARCRDALDEPGLLHEAREWCTPADAVALPAKYVALWGVNARPPAGTVLQKSGWIEVPIDPTHPRWWMDLPIFNGLWAMLDVEGRIALAGSGRPSEQPRAYHVKADGEGFAWLHRDHAVRLRAAIYVNARGGGADELADLIERERPFCNAVLTEERKAYKAARAVVGVTA